MVIYRFKVKIVKGCGLKVAGCRYLILRLKLTTQKTSIFVLMNIMFEYIQYLVQAKGRHGTHSPFVYDFLDNCLQQPISQEIRSNYKTYYSSLTDSSERLHITDLGAGSKRLSNHRNVSDIAKVSGSYGKYAHLLYQLTSHYKPSMTLELGTSLGLGTYMLSQGNSSGRIITIEGCQETSKFTKRKLEALSNIEVIHSSFLDFLASNTKIFDLVYIDGDHRGNKVLELLNELEDYTHDETLIIIDDIRWSADMLAMWKQLVTHDDYHLTMDLFRMGIISKRSHQQKEHFVIRF